MPHQVLIYRPPVSQVLELEGATLTLAIDGKWEEVGVLEKVDGTAPELYKQEMCNASLTGIIDLVSELVVQGININHPKVKAAVQNALDHNGQLYV